MTNGPSVNFQRHLSGIDAKLDRAEVHIGELRTKLGRHLDGDPETVFGHIHFDPDSPGQPTGGAPINQEIRCVIGDVIHNLRSALDQTAWGLVSKGGNTPTNKTMFPVLTERRTNPRTGAVEPPFIHGLSDPAAIAVLDSIQPYHWRNLVPAREQPLAAVEYLSNRDKHRQVATGTFDLSGPDFAAPAQPCRLSPHVLSRGDDYAEIEWASPETDFTLRTTVEILLQHGERHTVRTRACEILSKCASETRQVIDQFRPFLV